MGALLRAASPLVIFEDCAAFINARWKAIEKRYPSPDNVSAWVLGTGSFLPDQSDRESSRLAMTQNTMRLKRTETLFDEARRGLDDEKLSVLGCR